MVGGDTPSPPAHSEIFPMKKTFLFSFLTVPVFLTNAATIDFESPTSELGGAPPAPLQVDVPRGGGSIQVIDIAGFTSQVLGTGEQALTLENSSATHNSPVLLLPVSDSGSAAMEFSADFYIPEEGMLPGSVPSIALEGDGPDGNVVGYRVRFGGQDVDRMNLNDGAFVTNQRIGVGRWLRLTIRVPEGAREKATLIVEDEKGVIGTFADRPFQTPLTRITGLKIMDHVAKEVTGSFHVDNLRVTGDES